VKHESMPIFSSAYMLIRPIKSCTGCNETKVTRPSERGESAVCKVDCGDQLVTCHGFNGNLIIVVGAEQTNSDEDF
jgi:hypothetical protein